MNLFLHTKDLRIQDNKGLHASKQPTISLYVHDPRREIGRNQQRFIKKRLETLHEEYEANGGSLIVRKGKTEDVIKAITKEYDINTVYVNKRYDPTSKNIVKKIQDVVDVETVQDDVVVSPDEYDETPPSFSQFYTKWKKIDKPTPSPIPNTLADIETKQPLYEDTQQPTIPATRRDEAVKKWNDFKTERIQTYKDERDNLSNPQGVSRLSPYYAIGILSVREVLYDVENLIETSEKSSHIRNIAKYRSELAWREFNKTVLAKNPSSLEENYRDIDKIGWNNDEEEIQAWKEGQTGIPFVDAGMRQLNQTGYMHNRLRQNVASFLTKHLMSDWRIGRDYFKQHLFDHDIASNTGGWQWSASTGTDSVPLRIFNPEKQGRRYDKQAEYIKKWVPELEDVDPEHIHSWTSLTKKECDEIAPDYKPPIIDFDKRYKDGKAMYNRAFK